jgi:hypothetical protein
VIGRLGGDAAALERCDLTELKALAAELDDSSSR